jgi:hypothetical protein
MAVEPVEQNGGSKKLKMTLIEESTDFLKTETFASADAEFQGLVQTFQPPIQPFNEPLPKEPVSLSISASYPLNNPFQKVALSVKKLAVPLINNNATD